MKGVFSEQTKILLTGGGGFLGKHIFSELLKKGVPRHNIFAPTSSELDLRIKENCKKAVKGCDMVIHAAAVTGDTLLHGLQPGKVFYDNLIMGVELMDAARCEGVGKFVTVGSAAEYPENISAPFKESDLWSGFPEAIHAPYAIAKKALVTQAAAYKSEYGFRAIHLLLTNIYGPGGHVDGGVISSLIERIQNAKSEGLTTLAVWGTGGATRDFLYVEDAACGILEAAEKYDDPSPLNMGSGSEVSIKILAGILARLLDFRGEIFFDVSKPEGLARRFLDMGKTESAIGFRVKTDLETGLSKTIAWYLSLR